MTGHEHRPRATATSIGHEQRPRASATSNGYRHHSRAPYGVLIQRLVARTGPRAKSIGNSSAPSLMIRHQTTSTQAIGIGHRHSNHQLQSATIRNHQLSSATIRHYQQQLGVPLQHQPYQPPPTPDPAVEPSDYQRGS